MIDHEKIIKELKLKKASFSRGELKACCPNPQHEDSKPSWSLNVETGFYNCWSCGFSGKGLQGLYLKLGKKIPEWLEKEVEEAPTAKTRVKREKVIEKPVLRDTWLSWLSANTEYAFEELKERGVSRKILDKFGVGHNPKRGVTYFPIQDSKGALLGWVERCDEWEQRFLMKPVNVNKGELMYGERFIKEGAKNTVYVVEGVVDVIKLWQWGFKAVALLGNRMNSYHADRLVDLAEQVIIVPDNDKPGLLLRSDVVALKLGQRVTLFGVNLPEGIKDVGQAECTIDLFKQAVKNRVKIGG